MWKHNLKITFRNFQRNRVSFFINLIGLSTGLACAILIYMWVSDEIKYDRFHEKDKQLFQVMQNLNGNENDVLTWEWTPGILAQTLKEEMPEVEMAVPVAGLGSGGVAINGEDKMKSKELFAGEDFFNLFSFNLIAGKKESILKNKNEIVITEEFGEKLFGTSENLLGQTIQWEKNWENISGEYVISGVCEKIPDNSTIEFDLLFSFNQFLENKPSLLKWKNSEPKTYISLKENTDILAFNKNIEGLIQRKQKGSESTLFLRKFSDRYLYGNYENGVQAGGRIEYVKLFSLIAFFILFVACINFMNLATSRATQKSKEVGVKKTIGANRLSLIQQYLTESLLLTFFAFVVSLSLVSFVLPKFNEIADKELTLAFDPQLLLGLLGIVVLTGLLSGSYPAFYLSKFKPANVLMRNFNRSMGEFFARKGLVVFQFALSIGLVAAVVVVFQQMQYIQNKNLGYKKDNVAILRKDGEIKKNMPMVLSELKKIPGVSQASTLDGDMSGYYGYTTSVKWKGNENEENPVRFGIMIVGENIVETLGMEIVEGIDFSEEGGAIEDGVLINKAAQNAFGFENPIGKVFQQRHKDYTILGVVNDFHFESMYEKVKPCIMKRGTWGNNIYVKIQAGREQEVIAGMEEIYSRFNPGIPFEFNFLDEKYQKLYTSEKRVFMLSKYFAFIAIVISCLGLFGLAAFTLERKSKEISIRKILGSSNLAIVRLLSSEFAKLVLIAIFIALPISYWLAAEWLNGFAFHTELKAWYFVLAGMSAFIVAGVTVSYHSVRAVLANPVENLRSE